MGAPSGPSDVGSCGHSRLALTLIFSTLDPRPLARTQAVCTDWRAASQDPEVRRAAFVHHWKLAGLEGEPRQDSFLQTATVDRFVRVHQLTSGDSLPALAVRYNVDVATLKRVNHLMSDYSLFSRHHIFVPVGDRSELEGTYVSLEHCRLSRRDLAVINTGPTRANSGTARRKGFASGVQIAVLRSKLVQLLGRSLRIDDATASFYLEEAEGDVRVAMKMYEEDAEWEAGTPGPLRKAPVQRWIDGHHGL